MAAEARVPAARAADTRGKEEKGGGRVSRGAEGTGWGLPGFQGRRRKESRARGCLLAAVL